MTKWGYQVQMRVKGKLKCFGTYKKRRLINMEHKPIYLDGVDVNRCIDFNKRDKVSCYHILYDKCNENPNCYFKQLARKTQECEELKKRLMQNDEVNMFFNTPIEGWDNDPCKICESKNNYEQLKEDYAELKLENKELYRILADLKEVRKLKDSYRKALEEIEKVLSHCIMTGAIVKILTIISKAKGGRMKQQCK